MANGKLNAGAEAARTLKVAKAAERRYLDVRAASDLVDVHCEKAVEASHEEASWRSFAERLAPVVKGTPTSAEAELSRLRYLAARANTAARWTNFKRARY